MEKDANELIDAFQILKNIKEKFLTNKTNNPLNNNIIIFLDYDGTLSPIVDNPQQAKLPLQTKKTLELIAAKFPTIIISGRAHDKVQNFVQNDQIVYCGSHGLHIKGVTKDLNIKKYQVGTEYLPLLQMCAKEIEEKIINEIKGSEIEWNGVCFTIHYRRVSGKENQEIVLKRVYEIVERYNMDNVNNTINNDKKNDKTTNTTSNSTDDGQNTSTNGLNGLRAREGKMVVEVVPSIEWNKGKCLSWVLDQYMKEKTIKEKEEEKMSFTSTTTTTMSSFSPIVLYIGDDITDEDAFKIVNNLKEESGFGIVVCDDNKTKLERKTNAKYFLLSTVQVESFLNQLLQVC